MRQTYANAKKILSEFGATLDNVVEEVLYVTDMDSVRRCWSGSEGSVWVTNAGSGKYDCGNAPIGAANTTD